MNGIFLAIALAGVQPSQPAMASAPPPPMAAAPSQGQPVFIAFDPPLAERLVYRQVRIVENEGETQRSELAFAIEFAEDGRAFIMTVSPAAADGSPRETASLPPALARLSFRMSPEGAITEMVDEAAYWAAIEALLEEDVRRTDDSAEARGALWAMRQQRELPVSDRVNHIAQQVLPIVFHAGAAIDPTRPVEITGVQNSPVGPVTATSRTTVESLTEDSLTLTRVHVIPTDQLQTAMDRLVERFGRRPEEYGSRLISSESRQRYVIDRRTGLARSVRFRHSTISEESGQRRSHLVTIIVERIGQTGAER